LSNFKKFNPADLPVDSSVLEDTPIKGELNIESLIFRQIERTYMSALQDESLFASNVRLLLSTVPSHKRYEILEQSNEYTSITQQYQFKYCCGVPMGTVDKPVSGSPSLIEEEVIDWHKLFEMILAALEDCGISWKFEQWTIEAGKVEKEKSMPVPTPVFTSAHNPSIDPSTSTATPEQINPVAPAPVKNQRPCSICSQHVNPGTGVFYNHKLVHKEACLDVAKTKWGNPDEITP